LSLKENNEDCQYIGELNIKYGGSRYYTLILPYNKPAGIFTVFKSELWALRIEEIIIDNEIIIPRQHGRIYETIFGGTDKKISLRNNNTMKMFFEVDSIRGSMYDTEINNGINYYDPSHLYNIPYGSKEVKLKYRVYYPNNTIGERVHCVKFTLTWPDIRIADIDGNIRLPEEYIDLGIIKPAEDVFSIDLPLPLSFIRSSSRDRKKLHLDNEWLPIYELIGDGRIIEKTEISNEENYYIDFLTGKEDIKSGENTTSMIWRNNGWLEDGFVFYSQIDRPPIKYIIPYGTREVFMTYNIRFSSISSLKTSTYVDYYDYERICIKWEIDWQ
jgi:hypothetical protein